MIRITKGSSYLSMDGDKITITDIVKDQIYYESDSKVGGLIDAKGRYFMSKSLFANNLKYYNL